MNRPISFFLLFRFAHLPPIVFLFLNIFFCATANSYYPPARGKETIKKNILFIFLFISFVHSRNSAPGFRRNKKNLKIETQYIASTQNSDNSGYRATAVSLQLTIHRPINKPFTIRHSSCLHIYHRALPRPLLDRIPAVTREVVPELMVVGIPVGIGKFSFIFLYPSHPSTPLLLPSPEAFNMSHCHGRDELL